MKHLYSTILWLALSFVLAARADADALYAPLEAWNGELLPKDYGAFYIQIRLQGFKKNSRGSFITSNVMMHLQETSKGTKYAVSQALGQDTNGQQRVWKIPAGNYQVLRLSLNDNSGLTRTWLSRGKPQIFVRHLFLSNLGQLILAPGSGQNLLASFVGKSSSFANNFEHDAFAGVMNGYTQKLQKKLGGAALFVKAEDSFSTGEEARAAFSIQRQISMLYKVDLGAQQRYGKSISGTLASQDLDLRTCYMDQLDQDSSLQGTVSFRFRVNKADGTMQPINYQGGTIRSKKLVECLTLTLGRMQFPLNKDVNGLLTFYLNFKDEVGRASP